MGSQALNLASWSEAARDSSLKRFRLVPQGSENWRPTPEAMSFADLAQHLIDADSWLLEKLSVRVLAPIAGHAGIATIVHRSQYLDLLDRLARTGVERASFISTLSDEQLAEPIADLRFGGDVSVWWVIVRGNLDHEVHHRGQVAAYLRVAGIPTP